MRALIQSLSDRIHALNARLVVMEKEITGAKNALIAGLLCVILWLFGPLLNAVQSAIGP